MSSRSAEVSTLSSSLRSLNNELARTDSADSEASEGSESLGVGTLAEVSSGRGSGVIPKVLDTMSRGVSNFKKNARDQSRLRSASET